MAPKPKRAAEAVGVAEPAAKRQDADESAIEALAPVLHEALDEEIDISGIPVGWRQCPRMGAAVWRLIPMKVPLDAKFDTHIAEADRFNVVDAKAMVDAMLAGVMVPQGEGDPLPASCSLVIDLTNSTRYYDIRRWQELNVRHVKLPNRGRGEAPAAQAVNDFVWEVMCHAHSHPAGFILVHCTHGFNRSGYMIASYLLRVLADQYSTVAKAVAAFAAARPPGIYKPFYIRHLFAYYHQRMSRGMPIPAPPAWKGASSADSEEEAEDGGSGDGAVGAVGEHLQHDDPIGEAVCQDEADWVRGLLMDEVVGKDSLDRRLFFPGSQPVSLARSNLDLLAQRRYWVTWKADGTRYMVVLLRSGTYLVDRSNAVTRVQMRWPSPGAGRVPGQPPPKSPVGPVHHITVLDGEMVIDEDLAAGTRTRRFLAYDLVSLHGANMAARPWAERWELIRLYVAEPRRIEAADIARGVWKLPYDYNAEPFRFRRKDFWPLTAAAQLLHDLIPTKVSHEADGLIFQPHDDPYVPCTHPELLKWKFAHMNSVDFRLKVAPGKAQAAALDLALELLEPRGKHQVAMTPLEGARVEFPPGERPEAYAGRIVECAWDVDHAAWVFMRERRDKALPNARSVYEKVWASIVDDIREEELLQHVTEALKKDCYKDDVAKARLAPGAAPGAAPR